LTSWISTLLTMSKLLSAAINSSNAYVFYDALPRRKAKALTQSSRRIAQSFAAVGCPCFLLSFPEGICSCGRPQTTIPVREMR
jgi:hypothetical protein